MGQHFLEVGLLEGIAVSLLDDGLSFGRYEGIDDLPSFGALRQFPGGVPDPDDVGAIGAGAVDEVGDRCDDVLRISRSLHHGVLGIDDDEGGVRSGGSERGGLGCCGGGSGHAILLDRDNLPPARSSDQGELPDGCPWVSGWQTDSPASASGIRVCGAASARWGSMVRKVTSVGVVGVPEWDG